MKTSQMQKIYYFDINIISGDEKWFIYYYQYDRKWVIETDEIPEKVVPSRFDRKTMFTIFIGIEGLIFRTVKTANKSWDPDYFISNVLQPLSQHEKVQNLQKHSRLYLIHYDIAKCHISQKVKNYLINSPFSIVHHPAFSPTTIYA